MKKIKVIIISILLLQCACSRPIELELPQDEASVQPTSSKQEVDFLSQAYSEMKPWQIEKCGEISDDIAQNYLKDKGKLQAWYEDIFESRLFVPDESNEQEQLLDNFHQYKNYWPIRRDNMCILITEELKDNYYSIIPAYLMEDGVALHLVKSNSQQEIETYEIGQLPISAGFFANVIQWPESTILFGVIKSSRLGGNNCDEILPIDFETIEVITSSGEVFSSRVQAPGAVLLFFDSGTEVKSYRMLDKNNNVVEMNDFSCHYLSGDYKTIENQE